jgi:hypothetical protein
MRVAVKDFYSTKIRIIKYFPCQTIRFYYYFHTLSVPYQNNLPVENSSLHNNMVLVDSRANKWATNFNNFARLQFIINQSLIY